MDVKMWLDFALGILQAVAWPALIVGSLVIFRKPVAGLLQNVESAKVAGVETTFFKRALEDPRNSDETRDAVAELWADVATAKGQPVPQPASQQLSNSKRQRGRPASSEVLQFLSQQSYADKVKEAVKRVSDGRIRIGTGLVLNLGSDIGLVSPNFELRPEHNVGQLEVFIRNDPDEIRRFSELENVDGLHGRVDMMVIAPFVFETPLFRTACWRSANDDEALGDALEAAGMFDYAPAIDGTGDGS